jgi:uncharacterized protein (DUF58 family)
MISRPLAPGPAAAPATGARRWPYAFAPRFFLLIGLGVLFIVPAWIDRRAILLLGVWNAVVALLWILDIRSMPRDGGIGVSRRWVSPLALGVDGRVELSVRNDGKVALDLSVQDDVPATLAESLPELAMHVEGGSLAVASYTVRPSRRGDLVIGPVSLRLRTAWQIGECWVSATIGQTVRVYPDLFESRRQAMFLIRSRQVATEKRRARVSGLGRDFESLREYQAGDDVRDICWTATARRASPVTKVYQPEQSQAVWILVDAGRLLRARVGDRMKLDGIVNAALALSEVALAAGDRVGLITYGRRIHQRIPPARGHQHLRAILEALATVQADRAEGDHAAAATAVALAQKQRALIAWLTDLSETAAIPDVIESAARLSPRHVVVFAVTQQPELVALDAARPETEDEMYRTLAAQETLERRDVLLGTLRQRGVLVLDLQTTRAQQLSATLIDQYLTVKERNLI